MMGVDPCILETLLSPLRAAGSAPLVLEAPVAQPTAKRVIHPLAHGGLALGGTFDPKPALVERAGKPLPIQLWIETCIGAFPSPFEFRRHGTSGIEVSAIIPEVAQQVGDSSLTRFMQSDFPNRGRSIALMNTGTPQRVRSSSGSRLVCARGCENRSLPGFVALCPNRYPIRGGKNWRSAFLPGPFQETRIETSSTESGKLISHTRDKFASCAARRQRWNVRGRLSGPRAEERRRNEPLAASMQLSELAFRRQVEAKGLLSVGNEPQPVKDRSSDTLIACRPLEERACFRQPAHGAGPPWASCSGIASNRRRLAGQRDRLIAAFRTAFTRETSKPDGDRPSVPVD